MGFADKPGGLPKHPRQRMHICSPERHDARAESPNGIHRARVSARPDVICNP